MPYTRKTPFRLILFSALSLLLATGVGVLWHRGHDTTRRDQLSWRLGKARYTLRSEPGRLVLRAPPPRGAQDSLAAASCRGLSNDHVTWHVSIRTWADQPPDAGPSWPIVADNQERRSDLYNLDLASTARPLLEALEDPSRFAAAHVILTKQFRARPSPKSAVIGNNVRIIYAGMDTTLVGVIPKPPAWTNPKYPAMMGFQKLRLNGPPQVRIDPEQLPRIRDQWHNALSRPVIQVPHAVLLLALLGPIALAWGRRYWWRTIARRKGLCLNCGYDMRSSPERCPECG